MYEFTKSFEEIYLQQPLVLVSFTIVYEKEIKIILLTDNNIFTIEKNEV